MKVLLSAFSCEPGGGSESGVGWMWARAAAEHHDVWLMTRHEGREAIERELKASPELSIHPIYLDDPHVMGLADRGRYAAYVRYVAWQRRAGRVAHRLHDEVGFDVAHHVTWATDYVPIGVAKLRSVPLVVGPLGGTTPLALPLWRWLGWRGFMERVLHEPTIRVMRRFLVQPSVERARVGLALTDIVARRFRPAGPMLVEPNNAHDDAETAVVPSAREERLAVFAGRLVAWKGLRIAIATMRQPAAAGWRLEVMGDGPDRAACERYAARIGVADRVTFRGWCERQEVMALLARAHCLLYPSLRDEAPWIVSEALSLGTPVVCFDGLGSADITRGRGGVLVKPDRHAPRRLAEGLARAPLGVEPSTAFTSRRLPPLLARVYETATR